MDGRAKKLFNTPCIGRPMTGKGRFLVGGVATIVVITLVMTLLFLSLGRMNEEGSITLDSLEEVGGSQALPGDILYQELEDAMSTNQSSEDDVNTTVIYDYIRDIDDDETTEPSMDYAELWGAPYINDTTTENLAFISLAESPAPEYDVSTGTPLEGKAIYDLTLAQEPDGSWNHDISDTAMATYALAYEYGGANDSVQMGVSWLVENRADDGWGTVEEDSKSILALDQAGLDVKEDLGRLLTKQESNGSFGDVVNTSWSVMAISENMDASNYQNAAEAIVWLRSQEIEDTYSLALAALAEQYYNSEFAARGGEAGSASIDGIGDDGTSWIFGITAFVILASVVLLILFARLRSEDVLEGVRKDIFEYISENPGEHLAGITRQFGISSSSVRHHLDVLEWSDNIVSHKSGKQKHFYPNLNGYSQYTNGHGYKEIMATLKNDTTRGMVKFLIDNESSNQKMIAQALDLHPSTVNWHAKRLRAASIITKYRDGKDIHYSLNKELDLVKVISLIEGASS